jgi:hypothetical protein
MGGGALLGVGLTAAPTALAGSFLAPLFSNPITAIAGGALLIGSLIYAHNQQRKHDETTRNQISGDTGTKIWALIGQAQAGSLGLSEAKTAWNQIASDYASQTAQIKDSKTKRNATLQWQNDFMPLQKTLFDIASQTDANRARASLIHETFSTTAFASGGAVKFSDGGMMQPFGALYLGSAPFRGRVPGQYDRKDNRLAWLTGDETVITPTQKLKLGGDEAMARAGVPGYSGRNAFADGVNFGGAAASAPAQGTIEISIERAIVNFDKDARAAITLEGLKSSDGRRVIAQIARAEVKRDALRRP